MQQENIVTERQEDEPELDAHLTWSSVSVSGQKDFEQMSADEIAVVTSEDELELYEELEFYIWLDGHEKS